MRLSPVAVLVWILAVALHAGQVHAPATLDRAPPLQATGGTTHHLDKLEDLPAAYVKIAGRNRDVRAPRGYYAPW